MTTNKNNNDSDNNNTHRSNNTISSNGDSTNIKSVDTIRRLLASLGRVTFMRACLCATLKCPGASGARSGGAAAAPEGPCPGRPPLPWLLEALENARAAARGEAEAQLARAAAGARTRAMPARVGWVAWGGGGARARAPVLECVASVAGVQVIFRRHGRALRAGELGAEATARMCCHYREW